MGYRDDFYVAENLIGYTGELNKMPSVYFKKGGQFGHITQYHDVRPNIGREPVYEDDSYEIVNVDGHCVESCGGKVFHKSRNLFIEASTLSEDQRAVLMQSVWKCPEKKPLADIWGPEREKLLDQTDYLFAVYDQIKKAS